MKRRSIILIIVIVVIFLIGLQLCRNKRKINATKEVITAPPRVSVNAFVVKRQNVSESLSLLGTIIPNKSSQIISETQGKIIQLPVSKGDFVTKGKLIAQVENTEQEAAAERSRVAYKKAQTDVKRYEILYQGNAATKQRLEEAKVALENAKTAYEQDLKQLHNAAIKAPFNGILTELNPEVGTTVSPGSPIGQIVDVTSLKVDLTFPEAEAYNLHVNDSVNISTAIYPGVTFTGNISFISPTADAAHNYGIEIKLINRKDYPLKAGTFVTVNFGILVQDNPLVIPREALIGSIEKPQVYIIKNSTAFLKDIETGLTFPDKIEVLKGLAPGDSIVVSGLINLKTNTPVRVTK